jgi:hypothetical protein
MGNPSEQIKTNREQKPKIYIKMANFSTQFFLFLFELENQQPLRTEITGGHHVRQAIKENESRPQ